MLSFLNKPYPYLRNNKKGIITNFLIGSFIAFFLIVFKPFQIDLWVTEHKILKLIAFGFVSFFVPTLITFMLGWMVPKKILEDQWKIWHEILSIISVLCGIAFGNLVLGNMFHIMHFSWSGYFTALLIVLSIGIFPVTFYVLSSQNRLLKANLKNAKQVNTTIENKISEKANETKTSAESEDLVFVSENEKDKLILKPSQLLYIESADNYSNIVFTENGTKKKALMRSSLKRIESQLNSPFIMRCHRTFIINLKNVKHIEGNAAGYKIHFPENDAVIPVSRTYSGSVIEKLKSVK
jgi:hypothetical protein